MHTPALSQDAIERGRLWSTRARDWADVQERMMGPAIEAILTAVEIQPGTRLLVIGCGAGGGARRAQRRGARVSGVDAAEGLLAIARERVPEGDFRAGEVPGVPWPADEFDVALIEYADDYEAALAEGARVTVAGGWIGVVAWGSREECEPLSHLNALGRLMPPPPPGTPDPMIIEEKVADSVIGAGLQLRSDERVDCPWSYPDLETALRGLMSAGPVTGVIEHAGEAAVRDALTSCLADFASDDGGYLFRNKFRALTARVP